MTRRRIRTARAIATTMALAGVGLLLAGPVVAQDEVRTQTDLFGYNVDAEAMPFTVRFFESFIPIPTDPGDPQFSTSLSFTSARLGTGPSGRAVASSVWPGAALGDGFGTVVGDEDQTYPIRAAANYPGGGEDDWDQEQVATDGFGMYASARGLDVTAMSEGGGLPPEMHALARPGQVRSESTSTVVDGWAEATSISNASQVALLEGVIILDSVETTVVARSNGELGETDGLTTVGGITVLGQPARLTDQGVIIEPEDDPSDGAIGGLLSPVNQILQTLTDDLVADGIEDTLGIRIEAVDHDQTLDGAIAEREAGGIRITVDVAVLRGYLQPILDLVPTSDLLDLLPDEEGITNLKGLFFELQGLGPTIEYVVGRGVVSASASPAFSFDMPPPPPPFDPGTVDTQLPAAPPPPMGGVSMPPPSTGGATSPDVAPSAPGPSGPTLAAAEPPPLFQGIPLGFAGAVLLFAAVPTALLTNLREAAVGIGANLDATQSLPNLRGGA
jgi:hypothetical protein